MSSNLTFRMGLAAATGLLFLTLGLGLIASTVHAQATGSQTCEMRSAKNTSYFQAGTQFTIRQRGTTYAYTCNSEIGQWDEVVTSILPPVRAGSGVLLADQ